MKPAYNVRGAVIHIVHDYSYLVVAGTNTQKPLDKPFNHFAERTFLVHCRKMADFFGDGTDKRDLYARDFTRQPFVRKLPIWEKWADHLDKHLMHLTKARVTNKIRWTGEPNKCVLEEFIAVWSEFLNELQDGLKPIFNKALDDNRKSYEGYPI